MIIYQNLYIINLKGCNLKFKRKNKKVFFESEHVMKLKF